MKRVKEKELQQYIQKFNSKNIILNLGGVINAKIQMEKVKSNYNTRNGIMSLCDLISIQKCVQIKFVVI